MMEPQNFSSYREIDLNSARAGVFTQLAEVPYLSHRFKLQKFLGLTDDELLDNERQWREENADEVAPSDNEPVGFGATGLKGPSDSDMDLTAGMGDLGGDLGSEVPGGETAPGGGAASPTPQQAPAA
jgi:hypothetical protein